MIWVLFGVVLGVVLFMPYGLEHRRKVIDDAAREHAPGRFAALSQGVTCYQWVGPARGPVVVAIHGLTTPGQVWTEVAEGLGRIGYRVLVYDLYGRGLSDAAPGAQDAGFFLRQLTDLLDHQKLEQDLTIMGYSMGGAIATAFAARHPERIKRLILLAPAGSGHVESGLARLIRQTPVAGDWLHLALFGRSLRHVTGPGPMAGTQLAQLHRQGFAPAVLSSLRGILRDPGAPLHRTIGRADIPVVALWGDSDQVVPLRGMGDLAQWNRNARQEVIAGAGHGMPYTHAAAVVAVLTDVLRG